MVLRSCCHLCDCQMYFFYRECFAPLLAWIKPGGSSLHVLSNIYVNRNYGPDDLAVFGVIQFLLLECINLTINCFWWNIGRWLPLNRCLSSENGHIRKSWQFGSTLTKVKNILRWHSERLHNFTVMP